ncbi:response regulator transcription factor [Erysipelothrix sp. HDW6A]|uniref:response regulator transcription factor n=1 Tax=Erysipelothrix sp. HDW6A TaxID=2714928 RepID=UPI00140C5798|nr:response regulator transcription factor [Erysipelothrix sp. HDW6A]QIK56954.1 response regulator transcription factor [Erysipelothrix sp. HDW6A]
MRLLVVEDHQSLNDTITQVLKVGGYQVDSVFNGQDAIDYIAAIDYDCVVLDIMMPLVDGFTVVETVRKNGFTKPVLFLSAKQHVDDRIKALDLGGDDYLVKPFSMEELLARIRVLLRRYDNKGTDIYTLGTLEINNSTRSVRRENQEIDLSSKEYAILLYLVRHKNTVVTREQLLEHAWDLDYEGASNIVDVYINYLRKKIDDGFEPKLIQTVRGAGYIIRSTE